MEARTSAMDLISLKNTEAVLSSFLALLSSLQICIARAVDCEGKLAARVSHASWDVATIVIIPRTLSWREHTMAERMAWSR
jgi:hypothetical protein